MQVWPLAAMHPHLAPYILSLGLLIAGGIGGAVLQLPRYIHRGLTEGDELLFIASHSIAFIVSINVIKFLVEKLVKNYVSDGKEPTPQQEAAAAAVQAQVQPQPQGPVQCYELPFILIGFPLNLPVA